MAVIADPPAGDYERMMPQPVCACLCASPQPRCVRARLPGGGIDPCEVYATTIFNPNGSEANW
ncbi:hypothetical protein V4Y02_24005, partial [Escherichia coli]